MYAFFIVTKQNWFMSSRLDDNNSVPFKCLTQYLEFKDI